MTGGRSCGGCDALRDQLAAAESALAALREENEKLQRLLDFYHGYGQEGDGWCGEHQIRFQANATTEGDECQACRAKAAEAALADALLVIEALQISENTSSSLKLHDHYIFTVPSPAVAAFKRLSARRRA